MARKGQNNAMPTPSNEEQTVSDTAAETQTEQPTAVSEDQATIDKLNQDAAEAKARYEAARKAARVTTKEPRVKAARTLDSVVARQESVATKWMHLRLARDTANRVALGQSEQEATDAVLAIMRQRIADTLRIANEQGVSIESAAEQVSGHPFRKLGSLADRRAAKAAANGNAPAEQSAQSTLDEQIAGAESSEQPAEASVEQPAEPEAATA